MQSFIEYFEALWVHWTWIMTSGPFLLERITKQFWNEYEAWIRQFVSPARRRNVGIGLAVLGFFVANFLAFNDEKGKLDEARQLISSIKSPSYIPYEPISKSSYEKLTTAFSKFAGQPTFVSFDVVDRSAAEVASKIQSALKAAKLQSSMMVGGVDGDDEDGIWLSVRNRESSSDESKQYIQAFQESGIPFRIAEIPNEPGFELYKFSIWVGPRRQ